MRLGANGADITAQRLRQRKNPENEKTTANAVSKERTSPFLWSRLNSPVVDGNNLPNTSRGHTLPTRMFEN